jgi:hypothetical protein
MAYFNHAFCKAFVGTVAFNTTKTGMLGTTGAILDKGEFGFVDPETWQLVTDAGTAGCCNLVLASGSLYQNDKNGKFHGGYLESNKSKMINPKYVSRFYKVDACAPTRNVVHVGSTPITSGGGALTVAIDTAGSGYTNGTYQIAVDGGSGTGLLIQVTVAGNVVDSVDAILNLGKDYADTDTGLGSADLDAQAGGTLATFEITAVTEAVAPVIDGTVCCKEFLCDETYNLRIDVKGSPALRFLNHQAYLTAEAYTGCCPDGAEAPVAVDSTLVMVAWAEYIINDPIMSEFLLPAVYDEAGNLWYAPGTDPAILAATGADTWDNYVSAGHTEGACAGLVLNVAYVDTQFKDCTFQLSDFYELEPLRIYASETDLNGDPCAFGGLCVAVECEGSQANGLGETVARDVILSESYRQNFFHSDLRIREITQGDQILGSGPGEIDRTKRYVRYYLQHSVPRFNNPTGVFDNDQYMLEVIVEENDTATQTAFETFVTTWLETNCGNDCVVLDDVTCQTACAPIVPISVDEL